MNPYADPNSPTQLYLVTIIEARQGNQRKPRTCRFIVMATDDMDARIRLRADERSGQCGTGPMDTVIIEPLGKDVVLWR